MDKLSKLCVMNADRPEKINDYLLVYLVPTYDCHKIFPYKISRIV